MIVLCILGLSLLSVNAGKLPNNFKVCPRTLSKPQLESCLNNAIEDAIHQLANGLPNIGLPPLDPFLISEMKIKSGNGPIKLDLVFKNLQLQGISNTKVLNSKFDLNSSKGEVKSVTDKISLVGDYEVDGKILLIPVKGKGKAHIDFDDLRATNILLGDTKQRKNKSYIALNTYDYAFNPKRMHLRFENLFNGDKVLGEATNNVLNDNWKDVLDQLKPNIEEALSRIFKSFAKIVFEKIPLEELFPVKK